MARLWDHKLGPALPQLTSITLILLHQLSSDCSVAQGGREVDLPLEPKRLRTPHFDWFNNNAIEFS